MVRQVEHDGRHAFRVMDELGAECDRCGIKAVDARGKTMPASEFLNQIIEYVLAREADRERLRMTVGEQEAIADAAAAYEYDDQDEECARIASTLRGLLERTPQTQPTPGECSKPGEGICPPSP